MKTKKWGQPLPQVLGDRAMRLHERVLWRCAQHVCDAVGSGTWLALVGGTALRHMTGLKRASLDLDFVVADAGWQVGEWVRHVLERTEGVEPGSVQVRRESRLQTGLRYKSSETRTVHELQVDKLDATPRGVDLHAETGKYDGVITLHPERLAELKLQTLVGEEPRLKARDIYDATHLMRRYQCGLTREKCAMLGRICDSLFEQEEQWAERFDQDEVLSVDLFDTIREAFTKTTSWRKWGMDSSEEFKPVEGEEALSKVEIGGSIVRLVDNRPTYEGETIGTARGPEQAAAMLIEAGIAETGREEELAKEIEHGMEQARGRPGQ